MTIEVFDARGRLVRRASSADPVTPIATTDNTPDYWMRRESVPGATAGAHRWWWDLHENAPPTAERGWPMTAIVRDTPAEPRGAWVTPGTYTVRLTVDGRTHEQPLTVRMDPRVPVTTAQLEGTHALALRVLAVWRADSAAASRVHALRGALATGAETDSLRRDLAVLEGSGGGPWWARPSGGAPDLAKLASECSRVFDLLQRSDSPPTEAISSLVPAAERTLAQLLARERELAERARSATR